MPFTSWDEPFETEENVAQKGYCTHANYLFPSWHRPYLLLYEVTSNPSRCENPKPNNP